MMRIAIIGAGMAGVSLAKALVNHADVTVFEKARGVGGRMATRYQDQFSFDHGAPFFTQRSERFAMSLAAAKDAGVITSWQPNVVNLSLSPSAEIKVVKSGYEPVWLAQPKMTQWAKWQLAQLQSPAGSMQATGHGAEQAASEKKPVGFSIRMATRVAKLVRYGEQWQLFSIDDENLGCYDWVVSTAPVEQTRELLYPLLPERPFDSAEIVGCFSLMLGFEPNQAITECSWDVAYCDHPIIERLIWNHRKPNRDSGLSLVVNAQNSWSQTHIDQPEEWVVEQILAAIKALFPAAAQKTSYMRLQRWRYAQVSQAMKAGKTQWHEQGFYCHVEKRLAVCADWCLSGRVESAFLSAQGLADKLLSDLAQHADRASKAAPSAYLKG
ncbi:MAG: FAD-dependent oxidoreductase [Pseudomonadota bacterium]|nr:FAD-dependent oxidoreductase [Pseudomonadota bacterium]